LPSKIALVKKGGGCNFYEKVYYSELDGAKGVIIYDDIPFRDDDTSGSMVSFWLCKSLKTHEVYGIENHKRKPDYQHVLCRFKYWTGVA